MEYYICIIISSMYHKGRIKAAQLGLGITWAESPFDIESKSGSNNINRSEEKTQENSFDGTRHSNSVVLALYTIQHNFTCNS
jgi:hypothetical protein